MAGTNADGSPVRGRAPVVVLAAITANGSAVFDFVETRSVAAMQVALTGAPSGGTVVLTASLDGVTFDATALATFTIGTDTSGKIISVVDKPFRVLKATLASLAGGTAPTVTATVAAA